MISPAEDLTIAVPVFNEAGMILRSLESCVDQAGKILIYDNHSDDGTSEICASFAARYPHVEHIRHEQNIGAFNNFRQALFDCGTQFFQWIGAHDRLGPGSSEKLLPLIHSDPGVVLATGQVHYTDEEGQPLKVKKPMIYDPRLMSDDVFERLLAREQVTRDCFIIHGIFRADAARDAWRDPACIGCDEAFLFQISAAGKIAYHPEAEYFALVHTRSRKGQDQNERRTRDLVAPSVEAIARDQTAMTQRMFQTVTDQLNSPESVHRAFRVIFAIQRAHHENRAERKKRRLKEILRVLVVLALIITSLGWFLK